MTLLVGSLLTDAAAAAPDGTAATLGDHRLTFRQLEWAAVGIAGALARAGIGTGDRVAWWSGPDLRSIAGFGAVAHLGAVFVPLNPALSEDEASRALAYLRPAVVVAGEAQYETARRLYGAGARSLDELEAEAEAGSGLTRVPAPAAPVADSAPQVIYLTSGTTGDPKGVVVSHRASWLRAFPGGSTFASGLSGEGGILASFPLFHYGGWHYVLEAWHHRRAFHMCDRFDGATLLDTAQAHRPVAMYCIPAVWRRVLDEVGDDTAPLGSIRHADTGTSAAPPGLIDRLRRVMPAATTSIHYGSSEGGHHSTLHHREVAARPGSVGRVAPPGVFRLSEEGEILYRSPTLMDGYFERPDETAAALDGGWYRTGDLGTIDEEGYLWISGRAKELIRTAGEWVSPAEVEAALATVEGVADLAVCGLPDPEWGEVVCAAVVPARGEAPPSVESLRARLEGRLASYKHPRRVVTLAAVPRTPATGQVQRSALRDLVAEEAKL